MSRAPETGNRRCSSLRRRILFTILPAAMTAMVGMAVWNYLDIRQQTLDDFEQTRIHAETDIVNALLLMDAGYRMLEERLETEMRGHLPMLLAAYEQAGRDPARMHLEALKQRMGEHLDIYIIDADAVIRWTTDANGRGFDFKTYGLGATMQAIRDGNSVANERVRTNILTGQLGDWIYAPTPDHRYIIEIGYGSSEELSRIAGDLDPITVAAHLEQISPFVESVKIYDVFGYEFGHTGAAEYAPGKQLQQRIGETIQQGKLELEQEDKLTVYRYVDLASLKSSVSNPGKVVRIEFSRTPIQQHLNQIARTSSAIVLLFTLLLSAAIILFARRLTRPLQQLHETALAVAAGDHGRRAEVASCDETGALAVTFNRMLEQIAGNESRLEHTVQQRTAELRKAIRAREKAERDQLRLQAVALQARHMEGLGRIAGGVAHQFNNIMLGIMGHAELIGMDKALPERVRNHCRIIVTSVERGARLTRHLLAYTGQGQTHIHTIRPAELLAEDGDIFSVGLPAAARLHINCHPESPAITVDSGQFRQMLLALISNAGKAIATTGNTIRIETAPEKLDDSTIRQLRVREHMVPGDYFRLTVEDNGCGMDGATQSRMFEPFFATTPADAGLGLSALLGMVQGMHGGIDVQSTPGKGTRINVYLPAARTPAEAQAPAELPQNRGQCMLVADDEPASLSVASRMLEHCGFTVIPASSGKQAIEQFQEHRHRISGVILDMKMPGMGGEEVFARLRDMDKEIPIWICSGFDGDGIASHLYEQELTGFIAKPYSFADLTGAIRQYLAMPVEQTN